MENPIIKAEELPEEEIVYLKKGWDGYRVVYPIKNEDGTTNWLNLLCGGKGNAIRLLIYVLIGIAIYFGVNDLLQQCNVLSENPCKFCYEGIKAVNSNPS